MGVWNRTWWRLEVLDKIHKRKRELVEFFQRLHIDGHRQGYGLGSLDWRGPADGVLDYPENVRIKEDGEGFMPRSEVEDLA